MSAIPSFCEISIIKGKQIIWTIDLSKKENGNLHSPQIPETSPKNLFQLAHKDINDLISTLNTTAPMYPLINTASNIRKIAKKILKSKHIRLSELASELQLSKSNLRTWLKKGENPAGDLTDYAAAMNSWFEKSKGFLSQDEMYDVINSFNKSLRKNLIKANPENSATASSQLIEAVVLDNRFPTKKIRTDQGDKLAPNQLNLIQIDASYNEIHISDSFLWDEQDDSPEALQKFAFTLVKDNLEEQRVTTSKEVFHGLMNEIIKQIKEQVEMGCSMKKQIEPLVGFNANTSNFSQNEQIIKVSLNIDEEGVKLQDSFDWEIDAIINQPEVFAERYARENRLSENVRSIIASQIRQQIDEHLQKRMKNFSLLFEPKILEEENVNNADDKRKTNNKIKDNILYSLNEGLESFPVVPPFKEELFLKNQELFGLLNKHVDLLSPIHKKIFLRQMSCVESNLMRPDFKAPSFGQFGGGMTGSHSKSGQSNASNPKKMQFPRHIQSTQKPSKQSKQTKTPTANTNPSLNGTQFGGIKNFSGTPTMGNTGGSNAMGMPQEPNQQFPGYMPFGQTSIGNPQQGFPLQGEGMQESHGSTPIYNMDSNGFLKG